MALFGRPRERGLVDNEALRVQRAIGTAHPPQVVEAPVTLRGNAGVTSVSAVSGSTKVSGEVRQGSQGRIRSKLSSAARSLTAAANKIQRSETKDHERVYAVQPWQAEAWELFDQVGEQRFIATALAGQLSRARLFVGKLPEGVAAGEEPQPIDDVQIQSLLDPLGNGPAGRAKLLHRMGQNLINVGEAWLVGLPHEFYPGTDEFKSRVEYEQNASAQTIRVPEELVDPDVSSLIWRVFSGSELSFSRDGSVTLKFGQSAGQTVTVNPDWIYLVRIWREHPERAWEADASTRSSLPVLRELVGLTKHVSAQVDSRLAGAGVFIVPQTADSALKARQQAEGFDEDFERDAFTDDLIESMITPIRDRDAASAVAPLVIVSPDEAADKFRHISFASPLDGEAKGLREESIRRLALGQDAPPELLLGTAGMNHWGAWLVQEDVITPQPLPPGRSGRQGT